MHASFRYWKAYAATCFVLLVCQIHIITPLAKLFQLVHAQNYSRLPRVTGWLANFFSVIMLHFWSTCYSRSCKCFFQWPVYNLPLLSQMWICSVRNIFMIQNQKMCCLTLYCLWLYYVEMNKNAEMNLVFLAYFWVQSHLLTIITLFKWCPFFSEKDTMALKGKEKWTSTCTNIQIHLYIYFI